MFENRRSEVFFSDPSNNEGPNLKDPKVLKKVEQMNSHGMISSNLYSKVLEFMDGEDYKSEKDTDDYIQSIVNARFAVAKISSGMLPQNISQRIELLRGSLAHYQFIRDYIKQKGKEHGRLNFNFQEQLKICDEMCDLLPIKIDKIRLGFMN